MSNSPTGKAAASSRPQQLQQIKRLIALNFFSATEKLDGLTQSSFPLTRIRNSILVQLPLRRGRQSPRFVIRAKCQSGSDLPDSLRHHFSDRFHALRCGVGMNDGSSVARNSSGSKGAAFENAVQNFFDPKSKTVGFGKAFDLRFAVARPQNDRKLAEAINSLVVHFDNDDPFEVREDFFNAVR